MRASFQSSVLQLHKNYYQTSSKLNNTNISSQIRFVTSRRCTETRAEFDPVELIKDRLVQIWVEAHVENSSCTSTRSSAVLRETVKYEAPQNISMSWLRNNLRLRWRAAENESALAEVRFRRDEHPKESWESRITNTTSETSTALSHVLTDQVIDVDLSKLTVYRVQIRQRSNQAPNPLWSDWSPVMIVPAELEQKPEVTATTRVENGTREVTLTWKPMPHAEAVTGVTYVLKHEYSGGCPWVKKTHIIKSTKHTSYVLYSAVNISVIARNTASLSPPAVIRVPAVPAADLKACGKTLLESRLNKKTCLELYELQDGENVITITARTKKKMTMKDYVRYLYFEHSCDGGRPRTDKMCLYYQKEGVPLREPQDFAPFNETQSSVHLSWRAIPSVDQRGFLTHYSLCSVKISPQDEPKAKCQNVSASLTKHCLENLTPGAKYNISLTGVTRVGEGPKATVTINTVPEKHVNVPWSLSLLILLSLFLIPCTCILKRTKNKIFPPVPTPVIPDHTSYQPESQEMLEREEEIHEVTLHRLHPEVSSLPEESEEAGVHGDDEEEEEDEENDREGSRMSGGSTDETQRSSRGGDMTDVEQLENEIAMLIYRNGLVFDVKTDAT
ncbi:oncostatin-M-specific receptor subunit beta isoform X2 [Larimichthys crocea]|uniref:oncostatin-M-specific receptor subunit beta isoform X2 n=1 Tax=Larimichthys crocea TaxID=215358 RepID=UPI000F600B64|nr:oncostatin-M-specific receptor subunit beta isoform X2 [Larimichthys crocea]XP_027140597.1 oncostatin-M-specific receptor subunit beta isoform X2 [Larimichthys crocea]